MNYEPNQVFCVEIYTVLEHAKWSHNGLKRCAYGADTVSFSNERCPSYPVYIGPFPCASHLYIQNLEAAPEVDLHTSTRSLIIYFHRTRVPPRRSSRKGVAKGLFVGATVVRGRDWKWENQDGKQCMKYIIKQLTKSMVRERAEMRV